MDFLWILCEAYLFLMLVFKCLAILNELSEGLAITFIFGAAGRLILLDERFEAEFNSNGHEIGVLCYLSIAFHDAEQLYFLILRNFDTSRLFDPRDMLIDLAIHLLNGPADRQ